MRMVGDDQRIVGDGECLEGLFFLFENHFFLSSFFSLLSYFLLECIIFSKDIPLISFLFRFRRDMVFFVFFLKVCLIV